MENVKLYNRVDVRHKRTTWNASSVASVAFATVVVKRDK